jgi:hypothetical protein
MKLPKDMHILFWCDAHANVLEGTAQLKHPNPEATAVWAFDWDSMHCPKGQKSNCRDSWQVTA